VRQIEKAANAFSGRAASARSEAPRRVACEPSNAELVHPGAVNQLDGVGDDQQLGQTGARSWLVASSFPRT
jgi:hypothetical protein